MRIALDVSGALGRPSGMRRYAEELIQSLAAVSPQDEFLVYAAYWKGWPELLTQGFRIPKAPNVRALPLRLPQRLLLPAEHWLGLRIQERALIEAGVDLIHGLANILPRLQRVKSVVTLQHVATPSDNAEFLEKTSYWSRFYFHDLTERAVKTAGRVIVPSEDTKQAALKAYGLDPGRVAVVWDGGPAGDHGAGADASVLKDFGLREPYLLSVSAIHTRKNIERLVRAYASLKAGGKISHRLVLVGSRHASAAAVTEEVRRAGLEKSVLFLEGVSDAQLRALYGGAALFVYPSLLEGFGLPMLEAMAFGAPVAAARASALPEIAGDAAHFFDGTDEDDMAAQIERLLADEGLRKTLIARGRERVKLFRWEETAKKSLAVYRGVLKEPTS